MHLVCRCWHFSSLSLHACLPTSPFCITKAYKQWSISHSLTEATLSIVGDADTENGKQVQIIKDKATKCFRETHICWVSIMISKKSRMNMGKRISLYYSYIFLSFKLSTLKHFRKRSWMLETWRCVHQGIQETSDMSPGVSPIPQCASKEHRSLTGSISHLSKLTW